MSDRKFKGSPCPHFIFRRRPEKQVDICTNAGRLETLQGSRNRIEIDAFFEPIQDILITGFQVPAEAILHPDFFKARQKSASASSGKKRLNPYQGAPRLLLSNAFINPGLIALSSKWTRDGLILSMRKDRSLMTLSSGMGDIGFPPFAPDKRRTAATSNRRKHYRAGSDRAKDNHPKEIRHNMA